MAETIPCATCGLDDTTPAMTKWGHTLVTCNQCNLTYVNPRSFAAELDEYFRGPYLETIESGGELRPEIADLYHTILNSLNHQINPSRLLDVGCAMGHFLVAARDEGWDVQGVECSAYAVAYGRSRWNLAMRAACDLRDAHLVPNDRSDRALTAPGNDAK
jgi:2-polyprenyl-3-methyl-5-hydroxy-6-metoxy-1,4-benzoquinol methylase